VAARRAQARRRSEAKWELAKIAFYELILSGVVLYSVLKGSAKEEAEDTKNVYTLNHIKYNTEGLTCLVKSNLAYLAGFALHGNFRLSSTRFSCVNKAVNALFSVVRLSLVVYCAYDILPSYLRFLAHTWTLNSDNWWVSKDEPFYGNCSLWNAIVCWVLWGIFLLIEYFIILLVLMLTFAAGSTLFTHGYRFGSLEISQVVIFTVFFLLQQVIYFVTHVTVRNPWIPRGGF